MCHTRPQLHQGKQSKNLHCYVPALQQMFTRDVTTCGVGVLHTRVWGGPWIRLKANKCYTDTGLGNAQ